MDKQQNITNDIKAQNRDLDVLKKHFSHCFDKDENFDFDQFKQELSENEVNISKESYGMDWLGKSYARILASDSATTLLKEDEAFNQKEENKDSQNLLLKGDNLEVLKHLSNAYYEQIKMIYIDPPYNTGSDGFVYQDDRKFTVEQLENLAGLSEEKAQRILNFTQSSSNSHSAWLTFMYPRLYIAKRLLKEDGVIFISIDDNEVAQLRLLMDEVFGEENFIANVVWQKKYGPANDAKTISNTHENILCYSRISDNWQPYLLSRNNKQLDAFKNPDNDLRGKWRASDFSARTYSSTCDYTITIPSGKTVVPPASRAWITNERKYLELVKDNRIWFGVDGTGRPMQKKFLTEVKSGITPQTWWDRVFAGDNKSARYEIKKIFPENIFETPKPISLIKRILNISCNQNDIVLDFFAGSGTTGDAVMQLNAEDGGNRKFILAQLPETIDPKKSKTAYDFVKDELKVEKPTIFEITKERLIRAAKKITEETFVSKIAAKKKEITDFNDSLDLENRDEKIIKLRAEIEELKNQDLGFKVFETMPIWEDYGFEADEMDAQLSLFDESKLDDEDLMALLITWKTYDGVQLTQVPEEILLEDYKAYYVSTKLYLLYKGFSTNCLKALLEKIDSDKAFSPTSIIAFGYHFESKNLREISENIKSYSNKKSIDIDFVTRY